MRSLYSGLGRATLFGLLSLALTSSLSAQVPDDFSQLPEAERLRLLQVPLEAEAPAQDPRCNNEGIRALEWVLDDPSFAVRAQAIDLAATCASGAGAPPALALLSTVAQSHEDRVLRQRALAHLGRIGTPTKEVVKAALLAIHRGPRSPRVTGLVALRGMADTLASTDVEEVVRAVAALLPAADIDVNQQAALLLAEFGPPARAATSALLETFASRTHSRTQVAFALGRLGDPAAIPVLRAALAEADGSEKATFEAALALLDKAPK